MSKYSFKFKLKVVTAYLNGEGGGRTLAKKIWSQIIFSGQKMDKKLSSIWCGRT